MKIFVVFLSLYLITAFHSFGQQERYRSFKFGIEPVFIYKLLKPGPVSDGYFGLRIEYESSVKRTGILSNNFSLIWSRGPWGNNPYIVNGQIFYVSSGSLDHYFLRYSFHVYPFGKLLKKNHLQGLYFGIGPDLFTSKINYQQYRAGYGFHFAVGLQFNIIERIPVSFEADIYATRDVTDATVPPHNADAKFLWSGIMTFKVGWIFNKKKKE